MRGECSEERYLVDEQRQLVPVDMDRSELPVRPDAHRADGLSHLFTRDLGLHVDSHTREHVQQVEPRGVQSHLQDGEGTARERGRAEEERGG